MEMAIASPMKVSCSFPVSAAVRGRKLSASLDFIRNPARNRRFFSDNLKGCPRVVASYRLQFSLLAAVVGDKTAVLNDCSRQQSLSSGSEPIGDKPEEENEVNYVRVCDKLIEVFMVDKPNPTDWRKLLAFSKEWNNLRPHFFKRCQDRADSESDPAMKHNLLRLGRKLKVVDEDVQRHNELVEVIRRSPSEINEIVARRRKDFTEEFFVHLFSVAQSYHDNPMEQNALVELGNSCLDAVEAYDSTTETIESIQAAQSKLEDIFNSPTLDAACRKIDNLVEKNQLDSTMTLMITKAWSAAKESNMTKDEAKDILYHLYIASRKNLEKLVPKETRIMKYLLTIEDPEERLGALKDAFTPPAHESEGEDDDLYTTPEKLHTRINAVVDAYNFNTGGTLLSEAKDLMNPKIIVKLEELKKLIEKHFM